MNKATLVERLQAEREARLAAMSPDERARYDEWRRTHKPGPPEGRMAAKLLSAFGADPAPSLGDLTIEEIQARLDELRAQQLVGQIRRAIAQRQGVFG